MVRIVHLERSPLAFADDVKGVAHIDAHRFVLGRVVDLVLANELKLSVLVALIEAQPPLGERDAKAVVFGILELAHHPHLGIG